MPRRSGTAPSEDWLYLNVWKPAQMTGRLPVLVWIYGGGWVNGGASPATYSGANLAREGILVASFNYRIGRFGWFAHPQLTRENADNGLRINYGTLDQIAALKWIQKNIAAFGGHPDNVTVMGESAGGVSLHVLNTSTLTEGLYHKAIIMSGANGGDLGTATLADAEAVGLNFTRRHGIADDDPQSLVKLRAMSQELITGDLNLSNGSGGNPPTFTGGPIVDGRIVTSIGQTYASGAFRRVPMMIGATSGDMGGRTGFMVGGGPTDFGDARRQGHFHVLLSVLLRARIVATRLRVPRQRHPVLHEHAGAEVRGQDDPAGQCGRQGHQQLRCEIRQGRSKEPTDRGVVSIPAARWQDDGFLSPGNG